MLLTSWPLSKDQNELSVSSLKFAFSYAIWSGDLNFRLEENSFNHDEIVAAVEAKELASNLNDLPLEQNWFRRVIEWLVILLKCMALQ